MAMGTCSMAPAAALATAGVTWAERCRGSTTPVTPAATAVRSRAPRFLRDRVTPSRTKEEQARPRRGPASASLRQLGLLQSLGAVGQHPWGCVGAGPRCPRRARLTRTHGQRSASSANAQILDQRRAVLAGPLTDPNVLHRPATGRVSNSVTARRPLDLLAAEPSGHRRGRRSHRPRPTAPRRDPSSPGTARPARCSAPPPDPGTARPARGALPPDPWTARPARGAPPPDPGTARPAAAAPPDRGQRGPSAARHCPTGDGDPNVARPPARDGRPGRGVAPPDGGRPARPVGSAGGAAPTAAPSFTPVPGGPRRNRRCPRGARASPALRRGWP